MTGAVAAAGPERLDRGRVASWAFYDLANTIYSAVVLTAFLPKIFVDRWNLRWPIGVTTAATLVLSACVSPRLGARVDRTGRSRPGLDLSTNLCCLLTALLFFAVDWGPVPLLLCFGGSLFAYQAALTFYNTLLPVVAPPSRQGFVSGLGTGLGYAGIPIALLASREVLKTPIGERGAFLLCAVLMTLGTIPLWRNVRDDPARPRRDGASSGFLPALRWARGQPLLWSLLLANFVCADVANTLIQYAVLYFTDYVKLPMGDALLRLVALSLTAMVAGLVVGRLADRRPVAAYAACTGSLIAGLVASAVAPGTWVATALLIATGGAGVAATWTVGRQLVLRVTPPERYGEALGLYGVTTKASIVGTVLFAVLTDAFGYPVAILTQAAALTGGVALVLAFGRRFAAARAAGTLP